MIRSAVNFIILISVTFCLNCKSSDNSIESTSVVTMVRNIEYDSVTSKVLIQEADSILLVIPILGCEGCVNNALTFSENENFKYKMRIVLTSFESYKNLRIRVSQSLIEKEYVTLDSARVFYSIIKDDPYFPYLVAVNNKADSLVSIKLGANNIYEVLKSLEK